MDGALMEVGPFRVKGDKLVENPGAWNQDANLLFVDQPIGVGLSTSDTDSYIHELPEMAADMMTFFDNYFKLFPEQQAHELYIAGESYAGQYIPYLADAINKRNKEIMEKPELKDNGQMLIDLKGIMIGNGWIDPVEQYLSYVPFAYETGLIKHGSAIAAHLEQKNRECLKELSELPSVPINNNVCDRILNTLLSELFQDTRLPKTDPRACVNIYDIRLRDTFSSCGMNWPPDLVQVTPYLRRPEVLDALNIDKEEQVKWKECSGPVGAAFTAKSSASANTLIPGIIGAGVPVLMFNGDQDLICNHHGNTKLIQAMSWGGDEVQLPGQPPSKSNKGFKEGEGEVEEPWYVKGEAVGTVQTGRNLTYIKVYNASHMVPFDLPLVSQAMLNQFIGIPGYDKDSQSPEKTETPSTDDKEDTESDTDKEVEEATWKAYYRAGAVALVVVVILTVGLLFFVWRNRRLVRQAMLLNERRPRGVHYEDGSRSGDSMDGYDFDDPDRQAGLISSLFSGIARWNPAHHQRRSLSMNKYSGLAGGSAGAGGAVPLTNLSKRDSLDSMLMSDEDENEEQGGEGRRPYQDLEAGEGEVQELVIGRPEEV